MPAEPTSVRTPSASQLDPAALGDLRRVARRLGEAGHRAWLVGGAVRDLALGSQPKDLDLASSATPEEVERLFEDTVPVGREFGTVLVLERGRELQHTTFRSELGYTDRRHPDRVAFGTRLEDDAARRDFTCNALYLDPLTDELRDPQGGLADLTAGRLRTVGSARERFREDALRLVRVARFAARLELEVEPAVRDAVRSEARSLAHVSRERVLAELERILAARNAAQAFELLADGELLPHLLPGLTWAGASEPCADRLAWLAALEQAALPQGPGLTAGLAWLYAPAEGCEPVALPALPLARARRRAVERRLELLAALERGAPQGRADRIRLVRDPEWPGSQALARARRAAAGRDTVQLDELARFEAGLGPEQLHPDPLLAADDLLRAGVAPGPRYGALLRELETLQLEGLLTSRRAALAWLEQQAPPAP